MARRKGWIWITLALVCAVGAGGLAFYTLQQQTLAVEASTLAALPSPTPIPTIKLPVAARSLGSGTVVSPNDLVFKDYPLELVPTGVISSSEQLDQQVLIAAVNEGDLFRDQALMGSQSAPLSSQIETGKTLIAVPADNLLAESGFIATGDHVDLLLTLESAQQDGTTERVTGYTVQNAEVFRVLAPAATSEAPNPRPTGFLLLLTPDDAVRVKLVKDSGGTIDMALRSPADSDPFVAPSLTGQDLVEQLRNGGR